MGKNIDYGKIYRKLHPRRFPLSPRERQRELRDLFIADQSKFKRMIAAALQEEEGRG